MKAKVRMPLPARFRCSEELTQAEKNERFHRYHFVNLKATDVKPLLADRFRPILKAAGFRRLSDSLSARLVHPHYVHCFRVSFSAVSPGRLFVTAGIALDLLPLSDWSAFTLTRINPDTDCLFTTPVTLPNGNPEFDSGASQTEALETIDQLTAAFMSVERGYFQKFIAFPEPVGSLSVRDVLALHAEVNANHVSQYGRCGATIEFFTLRLALLQRHLGNAAASRALLEHGLKNYQLYDLGKRYRALLGEMRAEGLAAFGAT